jgi:hypothetical protein
MTGNAVRNELEREFVELQRRHREMSTRPRAQPQLRSRF